MQELDGCLFSLFRQKRDNSRTSVLLPLVSWWTWGRVFQGIWGCMGVRDLLTATETGTACLYCKQNALIPGWEGSTVLGVSGRMFAGFLLLLMLLSGVAECLGHDE